MLLYVYNMLPFGKYRLLPTRKLLKQESNMTTQIELYDQERKRYRSGLLAGSIIFLIAWFGYILVRVSSQSMDLMYPIVMIVLVLSLVVQAYFALRITLLERQIRKDVEFNEALNNELIQYNELKAWRAAFFAVIGFTAITAAFSFFVEFNDLMLILLTLLLIGFGAHNLAVYLLYR